MAYENYVRVKDKLAVIYEGHNADYLIQMSALRPAIRKALPDISLTIVCREEYLIWLDNDPDHLSIESYKKIPIGWGRTIPLVYDAGNGSHPILEQIQKSNIIPTPPLPTSGSSIGVICTHGHFPVETASQKQIDMTKRLVLSKGYTPIIADGLPLLDRKKLADTAGFVVGVECDLFFAAMVRGVPTTLLESGKGSNLYKMMANKPVIIQR
jgi:hypothetical protein